MSTVATCTHNVIFAIPVANILPKLVSIALVFTLSCHEVTDRHTSEFSEGKVLATTLKVEVVDIHLGICLLEDLQPDGGTQLVDMAASKGAGEETASVGHAGNVIVDCDGL